MKKVKKPDMEMEHWSEMGYLKASIANFKNVVACWVSSWLYKKA